MALIDLSNFDTTLLLSTVGRIGAPDGNIFFNTTSGEWEALPLDEVATIIYPAGHPSFTDGTTPVANPLIRADGLKMEAIYALENQERASSVVLGEELRKFDRFTKGTFKFGGAYQWVNGRAPSTTPDRTIIRGSGWDELNTSGISLKTYFGNKGLSNIEPTSQPSFQQSIQGTAINFQELGQIDEAILVRHDSNGDGTPDILDATTYEAVSIRTYGNNYDRKETTNDLAITELGGYSTGFALNESTHLTTNTTDHPFADVSTTPTGVWVGMELNHIAAPAAKTGEFSDETGSRLFSWELISPNSASLDQMIAWFDAFSTEAAKEADGLGVNTGHLGKDIETWYHYNASGQVVTKSGVTPASEGLYLNNIPVADQQRVVMTDDGGTIKAYSFSVSVEAEIGSVAKADILGWYHCWYQTNYNTASAEVVTDSGAAEYKGASSTADANNKVIIAYDYTGNTEDTGADTNKDCVFLCEGDGGATQAKTLFTITKVTTVAFSCIPGTENNA